MAKIIEYDLKVRISYLAKTSEDVALIKLSKDTLEALETVAQQLISEELQGISLTVEVEQEQN